MKNASCFRFLFHVHKISAIFQSGKFVNPTACSLDSLYTEHGYPRFHTEHHLNWLTQYEYVKHD